MGDGEEDLDLRMGFWTPEMRFWTPEDEVLDSDGGGVLDWSTDNCYRDRHLYYSGRLAGGCIH